MYEQLVQTIKSMQCAELEHIHKAKTKGGVYKVST